MNVEVDVAANGAFPCGINGLTLYPLIGFAGTTDGGIIGCPGCG